MTEWYNKHYSIAFQKIVESSPMGMHLYELDEDNRLIFAGANAAADRILSIDNSQFIGKTIEEAFPHLAETEVPQRYREAASNGLAWETEQIIYEDALIKGAFQVVAFQTGPGRMAVQFMDISPYKIMESRLKIFEKAVDSSTDAIGMATANGKHFYQNPAFDAMFGDVGEDPPKTLYEDEEVGREVFATIVEGNTWEGEVKMYSANREIKNIYLRAYSSQEKDGKVGLLVGVHTDITNQKRLMEAAQKTHRLEALGLLAGGIAHDYNNILGAILGNVNLAMRNMAKDHIAYSHMSNVNVAIERAAALTSQLLTFAKGGAPIKRVQQLFPFVEETVRFLLSGANVSCSFKVCGDLWTCEFDKSQISQVIENLTINALQAMPNGGKFSVSAENVEAAKNGKNSEFGRYVALVFKDEGIGIPEKTLSRIYDPFFSTKDKGHGLGLSTSHSIVERHGGHIHVTSSQGQGATFTVMLPATTKALSPIDEQATGKTLFGAGKVLVMDDEPMIREVLQSMLETIGFEVVTACDGKEAIDRYFAHKKKGESFRAIFLDLTVPGGVGGEEAVHIFRNDGVEIPIFVVSGYASGPNMSNPQKEGFTASLGKPFKFDQLTALLGQYL